MNIAIATAPPLDADIEIVNWYWPDELDSEEFGRYRAWTILPFTTVCLSAYDGSGYVHLNPKISVRESDHLSEKESEPGPNSNNDRVDIESLRKVHPELIATPLSELPATMRQEIVQVLRDSLGVRDVTGSDFSVVVFCEVSSPRNWIGVVSYKGHLRSNGADVSIRVWHDFTAVNPLYRRQSFAPVISGMCGWLVSQAVKHKIQAHFRIGVDNTPPFETPERVRLDVLATSYIAEYPYIFRSFAEGVNFLLSGLSVEWDCRDYNGEQYYPSPPRYELRLFTTHLGTLK